MTFLPRTYLQIQPFPAVARLWQSTFDLPQCTNLVIFQSSLPYLGFSVNNSRSRYIMFVLRGRIPSTPNIAALLLVSTFPRPLPHVNLPRMATTSLTSKSIYFNPSPYIHSTSLENSPPEPKILGFHQTLPNYSPSPIILLPTIAKSVGISKLLIKDERLRFDLPSFKPLGLAWAIRNAIIDELSESLPQPLPSDISLAELAAKAREEQVKLIAATDGKLGRIVAKLGKYFGVESINTRIFVAEDADESVKNLIKAEGAEILVAPGDFEVAVREAWLHSVATDGILVNIDAEENYVDIPKWIVEGYSTIFQELDTQLSANQPDLIIIPVGVGGLAQAAVLHYKSSAVSSKTRILTVEPAVAACLHASLLVGKRIEIETGETIMKGLNYGIVAEPAWEVLKSGIDGSTVVGDEEVKGALQDLKEQGIEVGPCGGAVVAALRGVLGSDTQEALGLGDESTVVLICTEGKDD